MRGGGGGNGWGDEGQGRLRRPCPQFGHTCRGVFIPGPGPARPTRPSPPARVNPTGPIGEGFDSPISPREGLRAPRRHVDPREARLKAQRWERMPDAPAFFRDTDLRANNRTCWFDEDQFGFDEPKAFTTGGSLSYESGYIADFFQLRGALYTSHLTADGDQITILGQANGRVKLAGQEVTPGRQLLRTPFVNPYDVRMIPLTFEGVVLLPEPKEHQTFDYVASYLSRYKPREDNQFISFSEGSTSMRMTACSSAARAITRTVGTSGSRTIGSTTR